MSMEMNLYDPSVYAAMADAVLQRIGDAPDIAVVLGSGLGDFTDRLCSPVAVGYREIPGFPVSTAPYHAGKFVFGRLGDKKVLCMSGRFHLYEGYSVQQLAVPVRVFKKLGVKAAVLTNAAGAVNPALAPGDIMLIKDHIKLTSLSPLAGPNVSEFGERFFDVGDMYTSSLRQTAKTVAGRTGVPVKEGVYMYFAGPQFETPAEIRMARVLGADAVGMSTAPEALAAAHCKLPLLAVSVITNMAAGVRPDAVLSQEEVRDTAQKVRIVFSDYMEEVIKTV